jgi:phosphate transport system substrate-binding protein
MNAFTRWMGRTAVAAGVVLIAAGAQAADISGAGASFPYPLYAKWAEAYKAKTGIGMNYQSIGSGGGIKQIKSKTVDFGASDMPLKPEDLKEAGLIQFPTVMGGVVPVVNIKGIEPGKLQLTGEALADIYLGKITKWNAPAIAKANPGVTLPDQAIAVVHRSDGSGTTFIFADYLAKVNPEWKSKVGINTSLQWPTGIGGKGNEGVAATVSRTAGAIGYVEYAYAKKNKLSHAALQNASGRFVQPDSESFQSAAASADWSKSPAYDILLTNQPGEKSWPITCATFILMYEKAEKPETTKQVLDFFAWAYQNGDTMADELDYVPMPDKVVGLIENTWKQIKGPNGQTIWSGKTM